MCVSKRKVTGRKLQNSKSLIIKTARENVILEQINQWQVMIRHFTYIQIQTPAQEFCVQNSPEESAL